MSATRQLMTIQRDVHIDVGRDEEKCRLGRNVTFLVNHAAHDISGKKQHMFVFHYSSTLDY